MSGGVCTDFTKADHKEPLEFSLYVAKDGSYFHPRAGQREPIVFASVEDIPESELLHTREYRRFRFRTQVSRRMSEQMRRRVPFHAARHAILGAWQDIYPEVPLPSLEGIRDTGLGGVR